MQAESRESQKSVRRNPAAFSGWRTLAVLVMAATTALLARAQLAGTGAIAGTVTDSTGAVVANATVTVTSAETNENTVRTTTGAGDFDITPLTPGSYSVTVTAQGFRTFVQQNVTVNALQTVPLNIKLAIGQSIQTVTVNTAPPVLETADATLGAVMDNQMYSSLPLLMGYGNNADQRRSTDFEYLMPGVQANYTSNNSTDNSGIVNGSGPAGGVSEIYIDGINLPEADQVGDPRFVWTAFGMDSIDQFQVLTSAFPAQYAGQGVENYTIKSGSNNIHGSVYEYIRNTVLDAWAINNKKPTVIGIVPAGDSCASNVTLPAGYQSWCALGGVKATEIQNEYGVVLGGPIIKNKLFLSYNYGQYRDANGPSPQLQTVPTLAMMGYSPSGSALGYADYTGFVAANPGYNIYDPATQIPNCTGTGSTACSRTQFSNAGTANQIPASRFSAAAQYFNKFMLPYEAEANQSLYANNVAPGYPTGLSNWYQAGRLDYDMSDRNQLSIIVAFGRQASTGPNSSGSANALGPPFNDKQAYTPKTNVDIVKETWTINPHIVNQAAASYGRYYSLSVTPEFAPVYSAANSGLLNLPAGQAVGSFPEIQFSGGVDNTTSEATYAGWNVKSNDTYEASDSLQWEFGKHSFNFGGQVVEQQFNYVKETTFSGPMDYTFAAAQTGGFTSSGDSLNAATGISFASYMLGAVNTSSVTVGVPGLGSRWLDPSFWGQDDWRLNQKLTLNLGLRWDIYPSIHEVHNLFTWLDPNGVNSISGNKGTLAFAGGSTSDGYHTGVATPSSVLYKNIEPRLGLAYAVNPKTVIRASYDLTFARGDWTSGSQSGSPGTTGLAPTATAASGISSAPQFYWDNSACAAGEADSVACGWTGSVAPPAPPAGGTSLAEFATTENSVTGTSGGSTMTYFDPYLGSRTPEYINWTFGLERQLTNNMSISVSYVGSEGHFISVSKAIGSRNNELPESMAAMAGFNVVSGAVSPCSGTACTTPLLTQKATAANLALAAANGFNPPNPYTTATYVATNDVYQYYYPFPQYTGVSDSTSFVGNENWNALEITLRQRPSHGFNMMVNYTYSKSIDDLGTFRVYDNNRLDRSLSATDEPQNLTATVVYQLPIGRGHLWGDNWAYRAIASDWTVSSIGVYHSGYPILVTASGCGTNGILSQCMPSVVSGQGRAPIKYGKTASGQPVSFDPNAPNALATVQYLNPAAFAVNVNSSSASGQAVNVGQGPGLYVPGTASRVAPDNLWGMGVYNVDAALKRSFPIFHEWRLAFELDMTNVTNHVEWASPSATVASGTNASFGTITNVGSTYTPRELQGSLRINF